ncbi:MAG: site-specific DNA-methyltransferase [Anaerolineales bacterium]|nr:site-specific DNA-methyltransferase [Anaerolineales bacterium]
MTLPLPSFENLVKEKPRTNGNANKLDPQDRAFHDWYRFVLSFPPHLVRDYLDNFDAKKNSVVLDPFCGTGTTLVESKRRGLLSFGTEANSFAHFASKVKTDWEISPDLLLTQSKEIAQSVLRKLRKQGINDETPFTGKIDDLSLSQLPDDENKLILTGSISPLPLHKTIVLLETLKEFESERIYQHQLLALANALVYKISNLHFGPEVGVGKPKSDVPVITSWLSEIEKMANDLRLVAGNDHAQSNAKLADARNLNEVLPENSVDIVITSPPYPNEKDYTRITRLESVVLGFINNKSDLRLLKKGLMRSNTRNVYKGDDDDKWVENNAEIQEIANAIEARRIELGKTSGFEKLYGKVTKLYFGGMARHLESLRPVLRPNARLAYVVGDQASYLRIMIRTGKILGDIAKELGYEVERIDLFRTRLATATKEQLREEVVVLRWKG